MASFKWLISLMLLTCQVLRQVHSVEEASHCTSVAGMVKLLELEDQLIQNLEDYADELEKKLDTVRRSIDSLRLENQKARSTTVDYLSNPLNSFSLIRRMNRDWLIWQLYMEDQVGLTQADKIQSLREEMPTSTDVEEAVSALDRIQVTYGLKVEDIAKGLLNGNQYPVSLTALDSYAMAQILFDQGRLYGASRWIYQTLTWMENFKLAEPFLLAKDEVRTFYAETLLKLNQKADALKVVNIALTDKPHDIKLLVKKMEIEALIRTGTSNQQPQPTNPLSNPNSHPTLYEMGCRGMYPPSTDSKLLCRYNSTTTPFLTLAPLKMEVVGLNPYMVIYHDVLSTAEIEEMKEMATPSLKRATVFKASEGKNTVVKTRTSKVAWFPDSYNSLTLRLNARINDMTGFDLSGSEMLQLMNYGLGGHYDRHYDFFNTTQNSSALTGDRIATVLFYMSDVEQGGATVFPTIHKTVYPQRGSAIMWYNLKDDGEPDELTLHAACPVLVGSKWVCNKWIRERAQFRSRPCLKK
ncbi:prolyl 4-hydroxylase subunit alpha-2 isoform X2 [Drosophila bipectinata]|uniref:prolyl 4-hydroxylase subunit alpha-2 isoform X2 n=1 Tax=Drosophila bipectinata TaxID=42026 RepID=UPI0038B3F74D